MDDNKVVRGRCPWMADDEVVHGRCPLTIIKNPWMIQPSIQWTDKRATLGKSDILERLINPRLSP